MPVSFFQRGSVGSLRTVVVIEPSTALFFPPSEASTMMFEVPETPLTITFGRQPEAVREDVGLDRERRCREDREDVRARRLELRDL